MKSKKSLESLLTEKDARIRDLEMKASKSGKQVEHLEPELQKMEEKMEDEGNNLSPQVKALDGVLLTDISLDSQKIIAGNLSEISEYNDGWIHCLIIPSKMNQNEIDAFERRKIV